MVDIKILGNSVESGTGAEEYQGAVLLKAVFEKEFENKKEVEGTILLKPNFKAIGFTPEDIDIVVWINLKNFTHNLSCLHTFKEEGKNEWETSKTKTNKNVFFKSMLLAIELKSHTNNGVIITKDDIKVRYDGKNSSAFAQNSNQKYSLKNFISKTNSGNENTDIYITNLIWLPNYKGNVGWGQTNLNNLILGNVDFKKLIDIACEKTPPRKSIYKNNFYQSAFNENDNIDVNELLENVFNFYDKEIVVHQGDLSRKKLENVIQKQLDGKYEKIFDNIGNKTTIISGVPGSGKTLILLRFSYHLALKRGERALILTYNKALIADVNRLSRLAGFKDDPSSASVGTSTCLKLMRKLLIEFDFYQEEPTNLNSKEQQRYFQENFTNKYEYLLTQLLDYLRLANIKDIEELKESLLELNYSKVLIDESQDWYSQEKDILFLIFGKENLVISYGSHQLLRSNTQLDWTIGTTSFQRLNLDISFRQKTNLCFYLKDLSARLDIKDEIKVNNALTGGNIKIYCRDLTINDYNLLYNNCVNDCKNAAYDILLLVNNEDTIHKQLKFNGINIHDGTMEKYKTTTPLDKESPRVFNYQSCRGLEGWVVIANNIDVFLANIETNITEALDDLSLAETKEIIIARWLYMILSRPIDTMVISLKNVNSKYGQLLLKVANDHPDYCEIIN